MSISVAAAKLQEELVTTRVPLKFVLATSSNAAISNVAVHRIFYTFAAANMLVLPALTESGGLDIFLELAVDMYTSSDQLWFSCGDNDEDVESAVPILSSLPIGVIMSAAGQQLNSCYLPFTICVHFRRFPSPSTFMLDERPQTLFHNSIKCALFALCGKCDAFYTLTMTEQLGLWSTAVVNPTLLEAALEARRKLAATVTPRNISRIPCRIVHEKDPHLLSHSKYPTPDTTLRKLLQNIDAEESCVVRFGSVGWEVGEREVKIDDLWNVFRSPDLFLYICIAK